MTSPTPTLESLQLHAQIVRAAAEVWAERCDALSGVSGGPGAPGIEEFAMQPYLFLREYFARYGRVARACNGNGGDGEGPDAVDVSDEVDKMTGSIAEAAADIAARVVPRGGRGGVVLTSPCSEAVSVGPRSWRLPRAGEHVELQQAVVVHCWQSRLEARKFHEAYRRWTRALAEVMVPSEHVRIAPCARVLVHGLTTTVCWLPPLLHTAPMTEAANTVTDALMALAESRAWCGGRRPMGYRGADSRLYLMPSTNLFDRALVAWRAPIRADFIRDSNRVPRAALDSVAEAAADDAVSEPLNRAASSLIAAIGETSSTPVNELIAAGAAGRVLHAVGLNVMFLHALLSVVESAQGVPNVDVGIAAIRGEMIARSLKVHIATTILSTSDVDAAGVQVTEALQHFRSGRITLTDALSKLARFKFPQARPSAPFTVTMQDIQQCGLGATEFVVRALMLRTTTAMERVTGVDTGVVAIAGPPPLGAELRRPGAPSRHPREAAVSQWSALLEENGDGRGASSERVAASLYAVFAASIAARMGSAAEGSRESATPLSNLFSDARQSSMTAGPRSALACAAAFCLAPDFIGLDGARTALLSDDDDACDALLRGRRLRGAFVDPKTSLGARTAFTRAVRRAVADAPVTLHALDAAELLADKASPRLLSDLAVLCVDCAGAPLECSTALSEELAAGLARENKIFAAPHFKTAAAQAAAVEAAVAPWRPLCEVVWASCRGRGRIPSLRLLASLLLVFASDHCKRFGVAGAALWHRREPTLKSLAVVVQFVVRRESADSFPVAVAEASADLMVCLMQCGHFEDALLLMSVQQDLVQRLDGEVDVDDVTAPLGRVIEAVTEIRGLFQKWAARVRLTALAGADPQIAASRLAAIRSLHWVGTAAHEDLVRRGFAYQQERDARGMLSASEQQGRSRICKRHTIALDQNDQFASLLTEEARLWGAMRFFAVRSRAESTRAELWRVQCEERTELYHFLRERLRVEGDLRNLPFMEYTARTAVEAEAAREWPIVVYTCAVAASIIINRNHAKGTVVPDAMRADLVRISLLSDAHLPALMKKSAMSEKEKRLVWDEGVVRSGVESSEMVFRHALHRSMVNDAASVRAVCAAKATRVPPLPPLRDEDDERLEADMTDLWMKLKDNSDAQQQRLVQRGRGPALRFAVGQRPPSKLPAVIQVPSGPPRPPPQPSTKSPATLTRELRELPPLRGGFPPAAGRQPPPGALLRDPSGAATRSGVDSRKRR